MLPTEKIPSMLCFKCRALAVPVRLNGVAAAILFEDAPEAGEVALFACTICGAVQVPTQQHTDVMRHRLAMARALTGG
jgi:hypothetical protein